LAEQRLEDIRVGRSRAYSLEQAERQSGLEDCVAFDPKKSDNMALTRAAVRNGSANGLRRGAVPPHSDRARWMRRSKGIVLIHWVVGHIRAAQCASKLFEQLKTASLLMAVPIDGVAREMGPAIGPTNRAAGDLFPSKSLKLIRQKHPLQRSQTAASNITRRALEASRVIGGG
jgi:hypothetical protein